MRNDNVKKDFRFLNCWVDNVKFKPFVKEIWDKDVNGGAIWIFHQKLKAIANGLNKWSRHEYVDIF